MTFFRHACLVLVTVIAVSACTPIVETRGNLVSPSNLRDIQPMTSTRADVSQKWGPPTTVSSMDPNTWYYIGETTAQEGVYASKVTKRQIIRVKFDMTDTVTEVTQIDPKLARDIEPSDRRTPTAGKDFTMLQQFIGNLGKFNTDTTQKK